MQESCAQANPLVDSETKPTTDVNQLDLTLPCWRPSVHARQSFVRLLHFQKLEGAQERQKHLFFGF